MAGCCGRGSCSCKIESADSNIEVTGTGSTGDPFLISLVNDIPIPADLDEAVAGLVPGPSDTNVALVALLSSAEGPFYTPEQFGAVGDGVADDSTEVQAAMDAAFEAGGGTVYLSKRYGCRGDIRHRGAITVLGTSRQKVLSADDNLDRGLVALDATFRYRYGQWGVGSLDDNPGPLLNLVIDGRNVATELFRMECVDGSVVDCNIVKSAGNCVEVGGSQNTTIERCVIGHSAGSAINFYNNPGQGAGNIKINNTYFATSGYHVTSDSDPANFWPHDVFFDKCLFENYTPGNGLIKLEAGDFQFVRCVITNSNNGSIPPPDGCVVLIQQTAWPTVSTTVVFDSCYFNGGAVNLAHLVKVDATGGVGNNVAFTGRNQFNKANVAIGLVGPASLVSLEGTPLRVQPSMDWFSVISGAGLGNLTNATPAPMRWAMPDDATLGLPIQVRRESDIANRLSINRDGTVLWGDGASPATVHASQSWNPTFSSLDLGGIWRITNGIARRGLVGNIAAPATTFPLSGAATGYPSYIMNFTTDGASANVSVTGGTAGQEMEVGFVAPALGSYSITWPSNVVFAPGAATPQPQNGALHYVTLVLNLDGNWYEKSRSLNPLDNINQLEANRLTTGQATMAREMVQTSDAVAISGLLELTMFTATKTETINNVRTYAADVAAAATPTLCRVGLYSVAANGTITLLASTANDTTLWATPDTGYTRAFNTLVNIRKGQRYALGHLIVTAGACPAWPAQKQVAVLSGNAPRLSGQVSGQTDLPATSAGGSITNSTFRRYGELLP
jgi:hypothetical protein